VTTSLVVNGQTITDVRRQYVFKIDNNNLKERFDSVNCRIKSSDYNYLLGTNPTSPPEHTFSATAVYEYQIDQSAYIVVEKDYAAKT
jgi:hypothetical protein